MDNLMERLREILPWPASVALLSLACYLIALVCAASGAGMDHVPSLTGTLIFLLGLTPFYLRRDYEFNSLGLLVISAVGLVIAGVGWLFGTNFVVLVWMGMAYVMTRLGFPTARGKAIQHRIELEKLTYSHPPTGKKEGLLEMWDFFTVLGAGLVLLWAIYAAPYVWAQLQTWLGWAP